MPMLLAEFGGQGSGGTGTTVFGVAEDDVKSISMSVSGSQVTMPVEENTFQFSSGPSVTPDSITNVTANFADGHSVTLP